MVKPTRKRTSKIEKLDTSQYRSGQVVQVGPDGKISVPDLGDEKLLLVKVDESYRLIPLKGDIKRIYIEVSTKCNFDCITCIRSSWDDDLLHMSMGVWETVVQQLSVLTELESVHFGGFGEPMMHPDIFRMIKDVKNLGVKVEMITNGSYLTEERIQKLLDMELDLIFTSLDSPDEENYNDIRIGADFGSVSGNIQRLQQMKKDQSKDYPELGIEFVAMKKNFHLLPQMIDLAKMLKASQFIISNLIPYHESMKDEIVYDMEDTGEFFGKDTSKIKAFTQLSDMKLRTERSCRFVENKSLCINYLGDVSPCYALMHSYDCYIYGRKKKMHPCYYGNVSEMGLKDMWMEPGCVNFRRVVSENRFPSCIDCKSLDGCTYAESNETDCWGNSPSCGECLWVRRIIACP